MRTIFSAALLFCLCTTLRAGEPLLRAGEPLRMYDLPPTAEERQLYDNFYRNPHLAEAQYQFLQWMHDRHERLRSLNDDLQLAQAEIASLQRQHAEFSRLNVWSGGGNVHFLEAEDTGLALLSAQQRLNRLQVERGRLLQFQTMEYHRLRSAVERSALPLVHPGNAGVRFP